MIGTEAIKLCGTFIVIGSNFLYIARQPFTLLTFISSFFIMAKCYYPQEALPKQCFLFYRFLQAFSLFIKFLFIFFQSIDELLLKCNNKIYIDEKLTAKQDGAIAQNVLLFLQENR